MTRRRPEAEPRRATLAGVDGSPGGGWVGFRLEAVGVGRPVAPRVLAPSVAHFGTTKNLFSVWADVDVIAIDVPIGLPASGARDADREARRLLGRPRSASVFPAPPRATLAARSREQADRLGRAIDGRGVSVQTWNILDRIRDVDAELRRRPSLVGHVYESHPEVGFFLWNEQRPLAPKKTAEGRAERRARVEKLFPGAFARARRTLPKRCARDDDLLDALALLWSALRIASGTAVVIPPEASRDPVGLPMRILA